MFVLAGSIANGSVLPAYSILAHFDLPLFIYNKIYPIWSGKYIESKTLQMYADNWSLQSTSIHILKSTNVLGRIGLEQGAGITLTENRSFRIQFDLLIDNE